MIQFSKKLKGFDLETDEPIWKNNTILTNDPSITAWGWSALSYDNKIIKMGCIKTEKSSKKLKLRVADDDTRRISEVNKILLEIIKKYNVNYILSELQHGSQNARAAKWMGAVTAMIQSISDTLDIGIEWYSEGDSKKCLLGKLSATKEETINAINKLYIVNWTKTKYINEAIADALSIHYVASKQSPTLKLLKNK